MKYENVKFSGFWINPKGSLHSIFIPWAQERKDDPIWCFPPLQAIAVINLRWKRKKSLMCEGQVCQSEEAASRQADVSRETETQTPPLPLLRPLQSCLLAFCRLTCPFDWVSRTAIGKEVWTQKIGKQPFAQPTGMSRLKECSCHGVTMFAFSCLDNIRCRVLGLWQG